MDQPITNVVIEELTVYTSEDAVRIGALLPHLSSSFNGSAVSEELLKTIVGSPFHVQLVARKEDEIIGIATLSLILGVGSGRSAWLEDFVVSPNARGTGTADMLWGAMLRWCEQHEARSLNFTSKPSREAAHKFYQKHGAAIRETDVFKKFIND